MEPPQEYGTDPDAVAEACAAEGHVPWSTEGDSFHGLVQVCACRLRLYDTNDKEIQP